jgi:hypothetical protein
VTSGQTLHQLTQIGSDDAGIDDQVRVIAHYRVGADVDRKHRRQFRQSLEHPGLTVRVVFAGVLVETP